MKKAEYIKIRNRVYIKMALDALSMVYTHVEEDIPNNEMEEIREKLFKWNEMLYREIEVTDS